MGIHIGAHIYRIGGIYDDFLNAVNPQVDSLPEHFPVFNRRAGELMRDAISHAKAQGDSIGGTIECFITGLPAGIGEPMFGGVESRIAQIIYGIPAVKAIEFGTGVDAAALPGSVNNDAYTVNHGVIQTTTNHSGGISGGITNGMPVVFRTTFKPTPSIAKPQNSVNLKTMEEVTLEVKGRHDPCIVPRAVPVVEAAAAIAIYDLILGNTQTNRRK
jgi:chorismate synthase